MVKLAIVIVNYNSGNHLVNTLGLLDSVKNEVEMDVWVVDNNSTDRSFLEPQKKFPKLNFIQNRDNKGFGAANNQALKKVKTELILFLNPDTRIAPGVLSFMVDFMEKNPRVGASTCKAVFENGSVDWAYHRGFPTPWASLLYFIGDDSLYHLSGRDMRKIHEVDAISGSFFMTRRSVLEKVGLFDEGYWMYAEDIDLCFRIKKAGYKIMYVPNVEIVHLKGVSSGIKEHSQTISTADRETKIRSTNSFYQTMKIFYKKNMEPNYPFVVNWLVYLGIDIQWMLAKRKLIV